MASAQGEVRLSFTGDHFVKDVILTCVRWCMASPWRYRQGLLPERGVSVGRATSNRRVLKHPPRREAALHRRYRPVGRGRRRDGADLTVRQVALLGSGRR
jgi:transposase-like protein